MPQRVHEFGAVLKSAAYSPGEQYLGALRLARKERDHPVTPALKRAFDQTKRAILRDKAKADRAPEFQISDFPDDAHSYDLRRGEVAFPKFTCCVALAFILRRCELERTRWEDLTLDPKGRHRTLHIKKSKTDQEGKGVKRTLGCTCRHLQGNLPGGALQELRSGLRQSFLRARPGLTSSPEGEKIIKVKLVNVGKGSGSPRQGPQPPPLGDHVLRQGGPQHRAGDLPGRWHSDLVFQYGEEAWEAGGCLHPAPAKHEAEATKTLEGPTSTRGHSPDREPSGRSAKVGQSVGLEGGPPAVQTAGLLVFYLENSMRLGICEDPPLHLAHRAPDRRPEVLELSLELGSPRQANWDKGCGELCDKSGRKGRWDRQHRHRGRTGKSRCHRLLIS